MEMKNIKILISLLIATVITGCAELDLNPLSEGSSKTWYSNEKEIQLALNDLYRTYLWDLEINYGTERWTDNWTQRQSITEYPAGIITSEWSTVVDTWANTYKGIVRANNILNGIEHAAGNVSEDMMNQFRGEASFFRAALYSRLIFLWGDVPFYTTELNIDEAFQMKRTSKELILQSIYADYDVAINYLPVAYGKTNKQRITKGAAMALKARTALWMSDWETVRDAAKACMDLKVYSLYPNFSEYFLSSTKDAAETIFALPRSFELGESWYTKNFIPRTAGGSSVASPSWELFCSFPCKDGLPIDESPLYNPRKPFENRDPRCSATITEFGTTFLGYVYDPNPYTTTVLNINTGTNVKNKDTRSVDTYASYNGLVLKKGVDQDWADDLYMDADIIIMRYADVLLMYAEAKIELNDIDASTLDAINQVRARAYGVAVTATDKYPAVTTTDQSQLRKILRMERRVEFAWENRRFYDLVRWRIAEKALTKPIYGMLDVAALKSKVINANLWFFPGTPEIDDDGIPDFTAMYEAGLIKLLVQRNFNSRQYLWPIPSKEIKINPNLTQNPDY